MNPPDAGRALSEALKNPREPVTIADAATASGLALRDAERGLQWLTSEYRGHLRVTESGELLFLFPYGFEKPWQTRDAFHRAFAAVGRSAAGVMRFVVRAWVMIVLVAYVALFVAVMIGLMFASQSDRDDRRGGGASTLVYALVRALGDAFFWTFHPFSPFVLGSEDAYYGGRYESRPRERARTRTDETPFYEKVNRFFFGPSSPPADPHQMERFVLSELRAQKGRIGLADVMRVTGLPREQADPLMARLMLDYDGEVEVSEEGGIYYRFESMRKTARDGDERENRPAPAWERLRRAKPLTGNSAGINTLIVALNAFNLVMSIVAINLNLTLAKLPMLVGPVPIEALPYDSVPIVLGIVPLVFSSLLFALPIARAMVRPLQGKKLARENGRLGLLREILAGIQRKAPLTESMLTEAWSRTAGKPPEPEELRKRIVELGGDVEIDESTGGVRYRFVDLETEAAALEAEREAASESEKEVGRVVFGSDR